jgi:hypothetical protein
MVLICVKLNYGTFEKYPLTMDLSEPVKLKDIIENVERTIKSSDKNVRDDDELVSKVYYENLPGLPNAEMKDDKDLWSDIITEAANFEHTRILVTSEIINKGQLKKRKSKKGKKNKGKGRKGSSKSKNRRYKSTNKRKYKSVKRRR